MSSLQSRLALLLLLVSAAILLLPSADPADEPSDPTAALIQQLGDKRFARREAAGKELIALGEKALPALRKAMVNSADREIRRRALEVARQIMPPAHKSKSLEMELIAIDAGEFQMGSHQAEAGRRPDETQHKARIAMPYYIGAYEVTQQEYEKLMKNNPSFFSRKGEGKARVADNPDRYPVEGVSWFDAVEFCNRLSKADGFEPYYKLTNVKLEAGSIKNATFAIVGGNGYRLPTEAEWEYACRAGRTTVYNFGNETQAGLINCKPLSVPSGYGSSLKWPDINRTTRVGSSRPNDWGLHDMHGNAAEWCQDWYDRDYYGNAPRDNPKGPDNGTHRVLRGGSWLVTESSCRSASRQFHAPDEKNYYTGFRICRTP